MAAKPWTNNERSASSVSWPEKPAGDAFTSTMGTGMARPINHTSVNAMAAMRPQLNAGAARARLRVIT